LIAGSNQNRTSDRVNEWIRAPSSFGYCRSFIISWPVWPRFFLFPLLYTTVGAIFIFVARHGTPKPGEELPPEFIGWIFAVIGSLLFLLGIAIAICISIAGRSLAKHTRYWFAFVMACIECLFIPFGTILRVFTIIVLSRESVKTLFGTGAEAPR
jgi:hypothetical protein